MSTKIDTNIIIKRKGEIMKATVCQRYGGPEIFEIKDVPTPMIKDDEILVEVKQAIVSPTDCNFRSGKPAISRLFSGLLKPKQQIQGEMFQGIITEIGDKVTTFSVGDTVYGTNGMKLGGYGEYVAVKTKEAIKTVPNGIDEEAALTLLDGGITALPFLKEKGGIKQGQTILVIGASGAVGSMGVMIAKHFKTTVTGVCSTSNLDKVKGIGADKVIDYTTTDYTKQENQYDIIFDAVGKSSYKACKNILSNDGIYLTTVPSLGIMLSSLFKENKSKKRAGFMAAGLRKPDVKIKDLIYLEGLIQANELTPLIEKEFSINDLGEAQAYVETGHKVGNVIVNLDFEQR